MPNNSGPTGREWGELINEVKEIRHDLRTAKMNLDYHMKRISELDLKFGSMNARIYTTVSVAVVFISLIGFAINLFIAVNS